MVQESKDEGLVFGAGGSQSLTLTQPGPSLHTARPARATALCWSGALYHRVLQKCCLWGGGTFVLIMYLTVSNISNLMFILTNVKLTNFSIINI